jgi:hypothetical protein
MAPQHAPFLGLSVPHAIRASQRALRIISAPGTLFPLISTWSRLCVAPFSDLTLRRQPAVIRLCVVAHPLRLVILLNRGIKTSYSYYEASKTSYSCYEASMSSYTEASTTAYFPNCGFEGPFFQLGASSNPEASMTSYFSKPRH